MVLVDTEKQLWLQKSIRSLCNEGANMYVVYTNTGAKLQCKSMAECINKIEKGSYLAANIFKVKEDGTQERVYEYRK